MPSRRDLCCFYDAQENSKWWLIRLGIGFAAIIVLAAIAIIVLRFAVVADVKASVEDARLNSFAYATTQQTGATATSFLAYNISVALTVRNPNGAIVKYTKPLVAAFVFHDRRLYNVTVADEGDTHPPFKTKVHLLHTGGEVASILLGTAAVEDFKQQNATGLFNLEMRLSGEITYLGLDTIGNKRELGLSCPLSLQLAPPGPEVVVFREVSCKPEGPDKIYF